MPNTDLSSGLQREDVGQVPKSLGWIVTYQDMMSLLVVFFVLFFAISQSRPEEITPRRTEVVGHRRSQVATILTRHSNLSAWWRPVGHLTFDPGTSTLPVAELAYLQKRLLPALRATGANVMIVDFAKQPASTRFAVERTEKLADYLEACGVNRARLFHFYSNETYVAESVISRRSTSTASDRVSIYLAPVAVEEPRAETSHTH